MSILITTYEGNHSHPLPTAATAMASTTAAAACMLTSGSTTSLSAAAPSSHSTAAAGLNFSLPDSAHPNRQFYFTNPSISPSPSQPTITLDLTNPSAAGTPLNRFSSSSSSRSFYSPPANFSFSPSDSPGWSSRSSSSNYMSYAAHEPYYKSYNMGALRQSQESLFNSYAQKNPLTDTIAKAITSDPTFQSALAAAITSYVGGSAAAVGIEGSSTGGVGGMHGGLKWGEQLHLASSLTASGATTTPGVGNSSPGYNLVGSASSSSSKQLQGSLVFLQPTSKNNGPIGSPRNNS
ncbi:putative WRKY transcription factor 61 [Platanthera guangdongensis]|uniref:WRKY transcription factor 61 n=1 Tax=Platanthera guangdongensis TaxID=2320717 RepID=A0ABR2M2E7_9ASPA